jgi:hypothetical protein
MKPNCRRLIKISAGFILCAVIFAGTLAFLLLDLPLTFVYEISSTGTDGQSLTVKLNIKTPMFCKTDKIALFLGDKSVEIISCGDASKSVTYYTPISGEFIEIPVFRGKDTLLTYTSPLSVPGKHGYRGKADERYVVFDGGQICLLPEEYYRYDEQGLTEKIGGVKFQFDFPEEWAQIVPFRDIKNPSWADFYNMNNDAFAFGAFREAPSPENSGLRVYTLEGDTTEYSEGFQELYAYYAGLFALDDHPYQIRLLPKDGTSGDIIGGAGVSAVSATFDPASKRDWQLLSHRMFHSFYDTRMPKSSVHIPPNLWVTEGLATYYENMSMASLPTVLKEKLKVNAEQEFAMLFNRYLYMRIKDPYVYSVFPMDEAQLTSDGVKEFLHYTAAPLIVKAFEEESSALGNAADSLLNFTLENEIPVERGFIFFEAAVRLLGEKAQSFTEDYVLGAQIPPLWHLSKSLPPQDEILEGLNDMEETMGSWLKAENPTYPVDIISPETLAQTIDNANASDVVFLPDTVDRQVQTYSPVLYALLKDYYDRAEKQGIDFDDKDLRHKLLG